MTIYDTYDGTFFIIHILILLFFLFLAQIIRFIRWENKKRKIKKAIDKINEGHARFLRGEINESQ